MATCTNAWTDPSLIPRQTHYLSTHTQSHTHTYSQTRHALGVAATGTTTTLTRGKETASTQAAMATADVGKSVRPSGCDVIKPSARAPEREGRGGRLWCRRGCDTCGGWGVAAPSSRRPASHTAPSSTHWSPRRNLCLANSQRQKHTPNGVTWVLTDRLTDGQTDWLTDRIVQVKVEWSYWASCIKAWKGVTGRKK